MVFRFRGGSANWVVARQDGVLMGHRLKHVLEKFPCGAPCQPYPRVQ
jgi:hypothetical protein